ncbi:hypothetical protein SKAU_G00265490 [Synaphobranchus kaupii]|uniref:Cadherin domain-containing protein n=1 Tax=Synaphobranchus kaupii TaxID=118154 RepID=A0A9Q1EZG4_SYNKA|nr:hypothetical protein SKAU_G00265490 [Synaphobranchus kaupii]
MNDAVRKTLIVILDDANDNRPIYDDAPFNKDVFENTAVDTVLFQVTARDADYGLASLVSYKIVDSSSAFAFITVIDVPDLAPRFLNLPYSAIVNEHTAVGQTVFQVQAIDPDTGVNDKIHFSIQNINDNKPGFYNCHPECNFEEEARHFTGSINEQSSRGVAVGDLNIMARDLDEVS